MALGVAEFEAPGGHLMALFRYHRLRGMERFLRGAGNPARRCMLGSVESVVVRLL